MEDAIKQTLDNVMTSPTGVYADQEKATEYGRQLQTQRGDSADEVDPRKLLRDPTISELRWYYRRTLGRVLVEKPVKDAFKNGFDLIDEDGEGNPEEARQLLEEPRFENGSGGGDIIDAYKSAQIKARRDGFALLFFIVDDDSEGPHVSPVGEDVTVNGVPKAKVWSIDRLTDTASGQAHEQIQQAYPDLDKSDYEVRKTGIVVDSRLSSPTYREPLGYIVDSTPHSQFVHKDRVQHYTWNTEVDGDYRRGSTIRRYGPHVDTLGEWEGDPVLLASYDLVKGLSKGNWAIMQALFRNAAHMYSVKVPRNVDDDEWTAANRMTENITAKSALTFPDTEYEIEQHESGNELEPSSHYDVIFDQICAVHEMTRSVLFGTQSGTVSGSETDIKNYFSKVERLRGNRFETEVIGIIEQLKRIIDGRTSEAYDYDGVALDWGPLFKVDSEARIGMWQTAAQTVTTLIGQYALTPDEARALLSEEFVEIDLDDLTESQMDELDRIRLATSGQGEQALASEGEYTNAPETNPRQGGQEGGRPEGARQGSEGSGATPTGDSLTEDLERLSELHEDGLLTDDEFQAAKDEILTE